MALRFTRLSIPVLAISACACGPREPAEAPAAPAPVAVTTPAPPAAEESTPRGLEVAQSEPPPRGPATLPETIEIAIALLQANDHRGLILQLLDPEDRAKIRERGQDLDSLVREFGDSDKPKQLLEVLISVRGQEPEMSNDGTVATLQGNAPDAPKGGKLEFRRVGDRWYLQN